MTTVAHSWYMTIRHIRNLLRQPIWVFITLVQPLIWLLLYGALFKRVVEIPGFGGGSYLDFLTPGIVVMSALFSSGWSGMALLDDLDRGVLDRFLVSPASRVSLISGRLVQGALIVIVQSLILVVLALVAGADLAGGPVGVLVLIAASILLGWAFGSLSNGLALLVRREETLIAAVNLVILPLTFLSTVFMQRALTPGWIQDVARVNPVDWAVTAGREALAREVDSGVVLGHLGLLLAFALLCTWFASRAFRAYQRSV
ncbi:MAG TPA: ABC transporter permease [Solirubrobacteraceae bacterium]|nr:ABC transporter permease [Solirubrobacteraceae bacterium]